MPRDDHSLSGSPTLRFCWGWRFAGDQDVDWHEHGETELVMVRHGRCVVEVAGQRLEAGPGGLFILPAGVPQYQESLERTETTCLGFQAPRALFDSSARVTTFNHTDPVHAWIEQLCDWQLTIPAIGAEVKLRWLELLLRRIQEVEMAMGRQSSQHPAVAMAVAYFQEHLSEALSLTEVARQVGVSVSHLTGLFKRHCGCSPMQYLQRTRMERAAWLLDNPYLRIHEVAAACGYDDVNYFVRLFTRLHGQPPGRWRKSRARLPTPS